MNRPRETFTRISRDNQNILSIQHFQKKYSNFQKDRTEAIAVIGMNCRFPGGANDPAAFWKLLCNGVDALREIPPERWNIDEFYSADSRAAGKMNSRVAGLLDQVDLFDASFFGISPREAASMDPQQRLFLEVAWDALEHAGQDMNRLAGSMVGVFVGVANNDYYHMQLTNGQIDGTYVETGNRQSFLSGRVSYALNFKGPALTIDTVCSSSLVAVHLACQSLRNKESHLALAGSVNLILSPIFSVLASQLQTLSPDNQCRTFDSRANGFVRGEGCGVVVLKRLSDALADGDPILALIRGSAVNQDGRSTALTAPNVLSQQELIQQALKNAGVDSSLVSYIETHGTGTPLGDPIEVAALAATVGQPRTNALPCYLGAVKTNIGHLEATSGMAGLIKALLCLQQRTIPPNLHFQQLNPHISLENTPFVIPTTLCGWEVGDVPRYAGVSAFGLSGTNAHVVLEEAPRVSPDNGFEQISSTTDQRSVVLALSARSPQALYDLANRYCSFLQESTESLNNICYSAAVRRTHHRHRLAVTAQTREECIEALQTALARTDQEELLLRAKERGQKQVVFIFPGQGSQWTGMGRELLAQEIVFAQTLASCEQALRPFVSWSLTEKLASDDPAELQSIAVLQPVLFALQVSLAALWRSWGIHPDAIIGHSMGEVAAAVVAGILSLEEGASIISRRSQFLSRLAGQGAMLVVELDAERARQVLAPWQDRVAVAVSNSPRSTVLSGERTALEQILEVLASQQVFCRWVRVDVASHSPQVEPLRQPLLAALADLHPRSGSIPFYSTVRGKSIEGQELGAEYWVENLRQPVRFAQAVQEMFSNDGDATFLELSPHPVLTQALEENLRNAGRQGIVAGSMYRDKNERASLLTVAAMLYEHGYDFKWQALFFPNRHRYVSLPSYPWQRERFWIEAVEPEEFHPTHQLSQGKKVGHPLLSNPLPLALAPGTYCWQVHLPLPAAAYLRDCRISDLAVLPSAAYLDMILSALRQISGKKEEGWCLEQVCFKTILPLWDDASGHCQLIVNVGEGEQATFQFLSQRPHEQGQSVAWTLHADGRGRTLESVSEEEWIFLPQMAKALPSSTVQFYNRTALETIQVRCTAIWSKEYCYQQLAGTGLNYGASFQSIEHIWRRDGEALAHIQLPPAVIRDAADYVVHPALLDAALQTLLVTMPVQGEEAEKQGVTYLPVAIEYLRFYQNPTTEAWAHVVFQPEQLAHNESRSQFVGNIMLLLENGSVALEIRGLCIQRLEDAMLQKTHNEIDQWFYLRHWQLQKEQLSVDDSTFVSYEEQSATWLIFSNEQHISSTLKASLEMRKERCVLITSGQAYKRISEQHYQIDPHHPEDYHTLLRDACPASFPCAGVVYLWGLSIAVSEEVVPPDDLLLLPSQEKALEQEAIPLWNGDTSPGNEMTIDDLLNAQTFTCESALYLVQALARGGWRHAPRLWFVTQGAQPVDLILPTKGIAQSPLWGLEQTILYEQPSLRCTCIDLSPDISTGELAAFCQVCRVDEPETHLVLRGKARYAARLSHYTPPPSHAHALFRTEGTYLITGGLGGLGLTVAKWIIEQGAHTLVLLGRSEPSKQVQTVLGQIRQAGVELHVLRADIADAEQIAAALSFIHANLPPLRGIFHAAGVLDDVLLTNMGPQHFQHVMLPKVVGAWHLHTLTQQDPLDYFVLFSSAASLLGSPGQGNYAAANAFLDALASFRKQHDLVALSINWGPWSDVGLAAPQKNRGQRLALLGIGSISPAQGIEALERLLSQPTPPAQVGVIPLNVRQWHQSYPALAGLLFCAEAQQEITREQSRKTLSLRAKLAETDQAGQKDIIEYFLQQQVAQVLHMAPAKIDRQTSLTILGLESLAAIELRNRLENSLEMTLPATIVWDYPTIQTLAVYLVTKLHQ